MTADAARKPPPPDDDTAALLERARKLRERADALHERAARLRMEADDVTGRLREQALRRLRNWQRHDPT